MIKAIKKGKFANYAKNYRNKKTNGNFLFDDIFRKFFIKNMGEAIN
jgi:hypothetical protein